MRCDWHQGRFGKRGAGNESTRLADENSELAASIGYQATGKVAQEPLVAAIRDSFCGSHGAAAVADQRAFGREQLSG